MKKIVFKPINAKPKSWEEYCKLQKSKHAKGYVIDSDSGIRQADWYGMISPNFWRSVLPSKELVEAFLALMQLMSLRQAWIGDWEPDWSKSHNKCCINYNDNRITIESWVTSAHPLSFPTRKMAEEFLNCFKDLIKQAKPLL